MKHIKIFNTLIAYNNFINSELFVTPNISKISNSKNIFYHRKKVIYHMYDIMYADSNGNKRITSDILAASEGYTPIAVCIAGTNFFGNNEPARWISLKWMNKTTPDIGNLSSSWIIWGSSTDMSPAVTTLSTIYKSGSISNINSVALFDNDDNWNTSVIGEKNQYQLTDVAGKYKTEIILSYTTGQEWRTSSTISSGGFNAACCCWRYHTKGTNQGDWYLPAAGELAIFLYKLSEFKTIFTALNQIYPNDCFVIDTTGYVWTSTSSSTSAAIRFNNLNLQAKAKNDDDGVLAMMQY